MVEGIKFMHLTIQSMFQFLFLIFLHIVYIVSLTNLTIAVT